jgi:hypothetical protein
MRENLHAARCLGQRAVARRQTLQARADGAAMSRSEKAVERLVRRIKRRRAAWRGYLGFTVNEPRLGECLIHLCHGGARRDIRVLPDGAMRWRAPATFVEELLAADLR